jgi:hypothetical protein
MSSLLNNYLSSYINERKWNIIPVKQDKTPAVKSWKVYQDKKINKDEFNRLSKKIDVDLILNNLNNNSSEPLVNYKFAFIYKDFFKFRF